MGVNRVSRVNSVNRVNRVWCNFVILRRIPCPRSFILDAVVPKLHKWKCFPSECYTGGICPKFRISIKFKAGFLEAFYMFHRHLKFEVSKTELH